MAETSFPVVNKELGAAEWATIARAFGRGIVDMGGAPYLISSVSSVNNTVTIGLDSIHGFNAAILDGFAHRMTTTKTLSVPAVTTTTVYEIGLVYNPANASAEGGPITLAAWVAPGSTAGNVSRLPLHRITRSNNVTLENSPRETFRPRVAPTIAVSEESHLPTSGLVLSDTLAMVRSTGSFYRAAVASGTVQWIPLGDLEDLANATHLIAPGELVRRWSGNGTFHVPEPAASSDAANKGYVDDRANWAAGQVPSHNHSAGQITSGILSRSRIDGSTHAYNNIQSGTNYTLSVNSSGLIARFSSTERHKENASLWRPAPRRLLGPDAWIYDRVDPETREVTNPREVGTIAERNLEDLPEFVQWGPDHVDEDGNPETKELVQGWDYQRWTAAHQRLHKWHAARLDAVTEAVKRIAEKTGVDVSDLLDGLEWDDEGEA